MSDNTMPAVQELAAALRDALSPPHAASGHLAARSDLVEYRAGYVVGALMSLAVAPDVDALDVDVRGTAKVIREVAEFFPVAYPVVVADETEAGR